MNNYFCGNCGNKIEAGQMFCGNCGKDVELNANVMNGMNGTNGMNVMNGMNGTNGKSDNKSTISKVLSSVLDFIKNTNKIVLAIVSGAAVLVMLTVVIVSAVMMFGNNYKKPLDNLCKSYEKEDAELMCSLISEYQIEHYEEVSECDYEEICEERIDNKYDMYGDDLKVTYEIEEEEHLSDRKLRKLKREICERFDDDYDIDDIEITDAYKLEVEFKFEGEDGKKRYDDEMYVVKENGKWRLVW